MPSFEIIEISPGKHGKPPRGRLVRERVGASTESRRPLLVSIQPRWVRDPSMEPDRSHRPPRRLAPTPPQTTVFENSGRGKQEFQHVKKIGEGGQGRCDVVKRQKDGKLFVYKLMKDPVEVDSRRKPVEAKILQDILGAHPRIVQMYDYAWDPRQTVYLLEYCSAGDLAGLIDNYHENHGQMIPEGFLCEYIFWSNFFSFKTKL